MQKAAQLDPTRRVVDQACRAVLAEKDGAERLYFVVEIKTSLFADDLRDIESPKIECGKAHLRSLAVGENPVRYIPTRSANDVLFEAGGG